MNNKISMPDWEAVGRHYDQKGRNDLNYLVATDKRIVHHHSGIFSDPAKYLNREYSEEELLAVLGESENRLTALGAEALNLRGKRGLDCGCGRGGSTFILARDYDHRMLGITISDTQLSFARQMAGELSLEARVSFEKKNIYYDTIDGTFDFIWACESTEYMPDYDSLFKKWRSMLEPGGRVLLFAISYRNSRLEMVKTQLKEINRIYETRIGAFSSYLKAAMDNGFEVDDLIGLESMIIPYYRLRLRSKNRRGSEEALLKGLENGHFKYSMMLLTM